MKKNIILNKDYKNLRNKVFQNLEIQEFTEVYTKFKRLKLQYKLLKIAMVLEKITIPKIDMPIIRIFYKIIRLHSLEVIRLDNAIN